MSTTFKPQVLNALEDNRERQAAAVAYFNEAIDREDEDGIRAVCEYVLDGGERTYAFGAGFQLHCLRWLTGHYHGRYAASEDGSTEEETALEGFLHCTWLCKWIVSRLPLDLHVSREDLTEANEFMRQLYEDAGLSQAAVEKCLMHQSIEMGDAQAAHTHFQAWQTLEHDSGGDCPACEQNSLIEYYRFSGQYAQAVALAEPILSGELTCGEIPHLSYEPVIDSLIKLGRRSEAVELLAQAEEHISDEGEAFYYLLSPLAVLHIQLGHMQAATDFLDEHHENMVNAGQNNDLYYLHYLTVVAAFNPEAKAVAQALAAEFDQRNGNNHWQTKLELLFSPPVLH